MLDRVNKVLIGKDIARTTALTSSTLYTGTNGPADGEIIVLDYNKNILATGATIADSSIIYIAEAITDTYSYVTPGTSTAVTGVRRLILSSPIVATDVTSYIGRPYAAAIEQVVTITPTLTPVIGTEYVLRIVYTDTREHPGQVTATYRYVAKTATLADLLTAINSKINNDTHRRVNATGGTTNIILTGRVLPWDVTDSVNALDRYQQVNFKVFLVSNNWGTATTPIVYTTTPYPGEGTWQRVRDAEQDQLTNRGVDSLITWPQRTPQMRVVNGATYNCIAIESKVPYQSPDNQYVKKAPVTTEIYIPVNTGGNQMLDVLNVLNPWMESTEFFGHISF
jgi:hypothetical protein